MHTASERLAIVLLSLAISGCPSARRRVVPPLPDAFTNDGRIRAMLSVHAVFLWPDGGVPDGVHTVRLEDATRYLAADAAHGENRPAWSRRRRAIAEIAAVGLPRHAFEDALKPFGVTHADILGELCQKINCNLMHEMPPGQLMASIVNLAVIRGDGVDCASQWKMLDFTVAGANDSHAAYTAKITLPRPVAAVAKAIDPQAWDHCSKFFCPPERTYLAHLDAANQPVADPQLPFGSQPHGTLFENFTCAVEDCENTTFQNLLTVSAYDLPPRRQVTYGLHTYLYGSANGLSSQDMEILIDGGQLWAEPDTSAPGWTVAYADKTLLFEDDLLTGAVNGAWSLAKTELLGELAEMACCKVSTTIPTKCP